MDLKNAEATLVEVAALEVIRQLDQLKQKKWGRKRPAIRTHRLIKKKGIVATIEQTVKKTKIAGNFVLLRANGQMTWEDVVVRHPQCFTAKAVERSRRRLAEPVVNEA